MTKNRQPLRENVLQGPENLGVKKKGPLNAREWGKKNRGNIGFPNNHQDKMKGSFPHAQGVGDGRN